MNHPSSKARPKKKHSTQEARHMGLHRQASCAQPSNTEHSGARCPGHNPSLTSACCSRASSCWLAKTLLALCAASPPAALCAQLTHHAACRFATTQVHKSLLLGPPNTRVDAKPHQLLLVTVPVSAAAIYPMTTCRKSGLSTMPALHDLAVMTASAAGPSPHLPAKAACPAYPSHCCRVACPDF